jgi:hypothetical protein
MDNKTDEKKPDVTPPPAAEVAPKEKMAKVRVLRPFRLYDGDKTRDPEVMDRVGSIVSVPQREVARLTKKMTGQAKGFGSFPSDEVAINHFALAELA